MFIVVLVEPEYEINMGMAARAMNNFGVTKLVLVRPKRAPGFEARKYAKHSESILDRAKTVATLDEAVAGCDAVVGTTGAVSRFNRHLKNCVSIAEVRGKLLRGDKVALVFGNEGIGLSESDLEKCDFISTIPTSARQPILNLSHAVAVVLYELSSKKFRRYYKAGSRDKLGLISGMFDGMVSSLDAIRNKKKVVNAFRKTLARARPGDNELQAMLVAFSKLEKKLKKEKG